MTEKEFMNMVMHEKYNCFEIVGLYLSFVERHLLSIIDFGSETIKAGTKLYRIRNYDKDKNYNDCKEWQPNPNPNINRCNRKNEIALYLGSTEDICLLEVNLSNEKYVLGEYEVIEDIVCGRFNELYRNNVTPTIDVFLNAFLIANNHSEILNKMPFNVISFEDIKITDFISTKASFMIGKAFDNQKIDNNSNYYNLTNRICDLIKHKYQGIRYGSCYIPLESPCLDFSLYNLALFSSEINKVKFCSASIKNVDDYTVKHYTSSMQNMKIDLMKICIKE